MISGKLSGRSPVDFFWFPPTPLTTSKEVFLLAFKYGIQEQKIIFNKHKQMFIMRKEIISKRKIYIPMMGLVLLLNGFVNITTKKTSI